MAFIYIRTKISVTYLVNFHFHILRNQLARFALPEWRCLHQQLGKCVGLDRQKNILSWWNSGKPHLKSNKQVDEYLSRLYLSTRTVIAKAKWQFGWHDMLLQHFLLTLLGSADWNCHNSYISLQLNVGIGRSCSCKKHCSSTGFSISPSCTWALVRGPLPTSMARTTRLVALIVFLVPK